MFWIALSLIFAGMTAPALAAQEAAAQEAGTVQAGVAQEQAGPVADSRRQEGGRRQIVAILDQQAEAWNQGDFESFVSFYTEDTVFLATTGVTRGRSEVLARYRRRYVDRAAMGHLTFEVVDVRLSPDGRAGSVAAHWHLRYPDGADREDASGLTLLACHRTDDGWRIVQDASM